MKMKSLRLAMLTALVLATSGFLTTAIAGGPPPWAPAHGWRAKHHYVYYPAAEVYYSPVSSLWFWLGGEGWQAGVSLPLALRGYVRTGGINIALDVDRPYLRNSYVVRRYGGHHHKYWRHDDDSRYRYHRDDDNDHGWRHRDDDDDQGWRHHDNDNDQGRRHHDRGHGHGHGHGRGH